MFGFETLALSAALTLAPGHTILDDPAATRDAAEALLGVGSCTLDVLALPERCDRPFSVVVSTSRGMAVLDLEPNSVRADGFTVYEALPDGSLRVVDAGPERTFVGVVDGIEGSVVAATLGHDGLWATVLYADGGRTWIEPLHGRIDDAPKGLHVAYENDDLHERDAVCGMPHVDRRPVALKDDVIMAMGGAPEVAQIACEADYPYFQAYGSVAAVAERMSTIINAANAQYVTQVGIQHVISAIIVRTSAAADPYTTTDAADLVCQFSRYWDTFYWLITRDAAHLFTGRDLDGSTIGRAAEIGSICEDAACPSFPCQCHPDYDTEGSYAIAQSDFDASFACATDLTAHELGHLWGASHCTPCETTMNSSITCANWFGGSAIADIVAYRNTRPCLSSVPTNNSCGGAQVIYDGTWPFATLGATTDGPAHGACENAGDDQVGSDIWFLYTAPCTGTLSVRTCNAADYDTKLAIYEPAEVIGHACPGSWPMNLVACNDDATGCSGFTSAIAIDVEAGDVYRIRVGGYNGAQGTGTLSVFCSIPNEFCSFATPITDGATSFSTLGANTDGAEHVTCDFCCNDPQIHADIWYVYTATCTGTLTVDTCDADFDTKLAVYQPTSGFGFVCRHGGPTLALLGCNDDACGFQSTVSIPVEAGESYRIRVGGYNGATGEGTLLVTCEMDDTCAADATGDGVVDVNDLLGVLSAWNTADPQFDIAPPGGDGVVDVNDLLLVLSDWGVCP